MALEGFSENDAAQVLDIDVATLREHVAESGRELAAEIATDVLIIEDELLIAMDLETIVGSLGHRVLDVATTNSEALAAVNRHKAGRLLGDVKLADGSSGLDAVREIVAKDQVPIIFITAYPEKVLTGERPEPTFLISKPFQRETVMAIISQALFFDTKAHLRPAAA
jgi:CheY-like chemotaxis protein